MKPATSRSLAWLSACLVVVACGGSTAGPSGSPKDAGADAKGDASGFDGGDDDSQAPESGSPHDAAGSDTSTTEAGGSEGGQGTLACGPTLLCDVSSQFCFEEGGGPPPLDGGSNMTYACVAIPAACLVNPTCACIQASDAGGGCPCSIQDGGFVAACLFP
jgi:hypothetical protein